MWGDDLSLENRVLKISTKLHAHATDVASPTGRPPLSPPATGYVAHPVPWDVDKEPVLLLLLPPACSVYFYLLISIQAELCSTASQGAWHRQLIHLNEITEVDTQKDLDCS